MRYPVKSRGAISCTDWAAGLACAVMLQVDIFSDVICPWCFIGKRRFERALVQKPPADLQIRWRAFQLNPDMPRDGMDRSHYLDLKFGGSENARDVYGRIEAVGLEEDIPFAFSKIQRTPSTVAAHRLIAYATNAGKADALVNALFDAYFINGVDIGDLDALTEIAKSVGLDGDDVANFLRSDIGEGEVMAETRFAYDNGINGVPCFIFNKQYAIAGAQEPESFFPLFDLGTQENAVGSAD